MGSKRPAYTLPIAPFLEELRVREFPKVAA